MKEENVRLGELVAFHLPEPMRPAVMVGRLMSVEHGVANIKGVSQDKYERAAYHIPLTEIEPVVDFIDHLLNPQPL